MRLLPTPCRPRRTYLRPARRGRLLVAVLAACLALALGGEPAPARADAPETPGNLDTPYTRLEPERVALLVVNDQNDFADPHGAEPAVDAVRVMPPVGEAVAMFRRAGRPIIHLVRLYLPDGHNADLGRREALKQGKLHLAEPGTWGSELYAPLNPDGKALDYQALLAGRVQSLGPQEFVILKPRYDAFLGTPLVSFLGELGVNSVVVVGLGAPDDVRATQLGATDRDFRVGLVPTACNGVYPEALKAMRAEGVQLMNLDELSRVLLGAKAK
ncbi:MAG: cysteine hydrolase [Deltaproteobacteria bacterium]|nr:cysteine hydrolase [Deltaproteobacteria bacterium]